MPIPARYPVLMPDTPPEIVTEIGKSRACRRLKEELITGARFQQEYMILRQARINEANRRIEYKRVEGLGELIARLDKEFYQEMIRDYGHECWADPDFMEDTLQKNPGLRLRINRPVRILVDGFAGQKEEKHKRATENRAAERTPDAVTTVPVIEHSGARDFGGKDDTEIVPPSRNGRCAGGVADGRDF